MSASPPLQDFHEIAKSNCVGNCSNKTYSACHTNPRNFKKNTCLGSANYQTYKSIIYVGEIRIVHFVDRCLHVGIALILH